MKERPLVSVIIPTYNRKQKVVGAIDSALAQTYDHLEIIVVDDGSNDGTAQYLQARYGAKIRLVALPDNVGGAQARNVGVAYAHGELLAFLDSDDRWSRNKIAAQVAVLHQQECGVVYTGMYRLHGEKILDVNTPMFSGKLSDALLTYNIVSSTSSVLVRKDVFTGVGGFNNSLKSCQDWDLWIRLSHITQFGFLKEPMVYHYVDGNDRISCNPHSRVQGLMYIYRTYLSKSENIIGVSNIFFNLGKAFYMWNRFRYAYFFFIKSFKLNRRKYKAVAYIFLCILQSKSKRDFYFLKRLHENFRRMFVLKNLS